MVFDYEHQDSNFNSGVFGISHAEKKICQLNQNKKSKSNLHSSKQSG